ncbi:MAG: hypothetical protein B7Y32_03215 [Methylophilales bacterium 16-45-7]|nr:MAG: hypothetical protein B7Y32_03215 [Methylophilales bacterium 16-45-7]
MITFKRAFLLVLLGLVGCALGITAWLYNPLDKTAWRVALHLPVVGVVHIRAWPLLQLGTSKAGRTLLSQTHWRSKHGRITLTNQSDSVQLHCASCLFNVNALSTQAIAFDDVFLTIRRTERKLAGKLEMKSQQQNIQMLYTADAHMKGIDLDWTLPTTAIADLLTPLKTHSETIQTARVTGNLSAHGTLHWPNRRWSAIPVIQGFDVTGLGTEKIRTANIQFTCPQTYVSPSNPTVKPHVWVDKKAMGRWLPMAVIIAEDAQFMHHQGYDFETLRYLLAQEKPNKQLGGSTISQQLAKYMFTGGERQWKRKIEELLYAVEMESTLGKQRILNLYLNTVDWGPGICGAAAASHYYFGLPPKKLSITQAAWLAGIIKNPHRAWQQQYLQNKPDLNRVAAITRFMSTKTKHVPTELGFRY